MEDNERNSLILGMIGLLLPQIDLGEIQYGIDWKNIYSECKYYKEWQDMNATNMYCEKQKCDLTSCKGCEIYESMMKRIGGMKDD